MNDKHLPIIQELLLVQMEIKDMYNYLQLI